jgi:hypothetical protein
MKSSFLFCENRVKNFFINTKEMSRTLVIFSSFPLLTQIYTICFHGIYIDSAMFPSFSLASPMFFTGLKKFFLLIKTTLFCRWGEVKKRRKKETDDVIIKLKTYQNKGRL